jgi:hypothetical protein
VVPVTVALPYRGMSRPDIVGGMTSTTDTYPHIHHPGLSADVYPDDHMVSNLTQSLKPRLSGIAGADLENRVRSTLEELSPVHVTAYLGVLVERRLRGKLPRQPG